LHNKLQSSNFMNLFVAVNLGIRLGPFVYRYEQDMLKSSRDLLSKLPDTFGSSQGLESSTYTN